MTTLSPTQQSTPGTSHPPPPSASECSDSSIPTSPKSESRSPRWIPHLAFTSSFHHPNPHSKQLPPHPQAWSPSSASKRTASLHFPIKECRRRYRRSDEWDSRWGSRERDWRTVIWRCKSEDEECYWWESERDLRRWSDRFDVKMCWCKIRINYLCICLWEKESWERT